eukprot:TRINITY_DN13445_c0_g1_i1.p1 TRINITY_DN13445_c0_g1~~TRINITY_DN13445_c0_g1_i1.p1  ORF type:complete len:495 (-),score=60.59 TRINITY_DN13445_c0_g1_i1:982-2445(-)
MAFSSAVKLDALDRVLPSQSCILPIQETKAPGEETKVTVSLNDCLACSGCVTTAEAILVQLQSSEEVYRERDANLERQKRGEQPRRMVVSLAPQPCASVAAYYRCSLREAWTKLAWVFRQRFGACAVLNTLWAENIAALEMSREFVNRYLQRKQGESTHFPILSASCPGWICYAEKTHPELLPHLSAVKSAQAILGTVIKRVLARKWNVPSSEIWHLSIYSCWDKKLEAARDDFKSLEPSSDRETDCVLSAGELLDIIKREGLIWADIPCENEFDLLSNELFQWDAVSEFQSSGAGLEFTFRYAVEELFGVRVTGALSYEKQRNPNLQVVRFTAPDGKELQFAVAYGFQQIQNIARQIKQKRCKYDFVEVMACPSGCLNGGGQIKATDQIGGAEANKDLLQRVNSAFRDFVTDLWSAQSVPPLLNFSSLANNTEQRSCDERLLIADAYHFAGGAAGSEQASMAFHTQYHAISNLPTQGLSHIQLTNW